MSVSFGALSLDVTRRHVTSVIMLDKSGSMTGTFRDPSRGRVTRLQAACEGACRVVDALQTDDHVGVFAFGDDVQNVTDGLTELSPSSKAATKRQIMRIRAGGRTRFYDTVLAGTAGLLEIAVVAKAAGTVIDEDMGSFWYIILSDGEDTCSSSSLRDVLNVFQKLREIPQGVLNVVLIGINLDRSARSIMQRISDAGGSMTRFVEASNLSEVTKAFDQIAAKIRIVSGEIRVDSRASSSSGNKQIRASPSTWLEQQGPIHVGSHVRCIGHSRGKAPNVDTGDIGVLKKRDSDGDYIVDFPRQDNWSGQLRDVTIDLMANRIRPGSIVVVKSSVTEPYLKWGHYKRFMHGMVVAVAHDGIVHVQIGIAPETGAKSNLWKAHLRELVIADNGSFQGERRGHWPGTLQLGMAVRVPSHLQEPSTGWGTLTRGEVGYVRGYVQGENDTYYIADFPSVDGWKGRPQDLEVDPVATLIRPGVFVRVRPGINPKKGWGSANRESVGMVVSSMYDGNAVQVDFKEHPGWEGLLSELEIVPTVSGAMKHTAVCDSCGDGQSIVGYRYKCKDCTDYDLCKSCYDSGSHNRDHAFHCMHRPDSIPTDLPPRNSIHVAPAVSPARARRVFRSPPPSPTSTNKEPSTPSTACSSSVDGGSNHSASAIFVEGTPVVFEVGMQVCVVGLRSDTTLNDRVGLIKAKLPQDRYLVQLPDQVKTFQSVNLEPLPNLTFPIGSVVKVKGLTSEPGLNGEYGAVVGQRRTNGRLIIKLFLDSGEKQVSLKPENLEQVKDAT